MNVEAQYNTFVEGLKLIALPYEDQVKSMENFVDVPVEITSTFQDIFLIFPQLIRANFFSLDAIAAIIIAFNHMQG
ncbi:MAG TPA: hypothetical protein VEB40_01800 [Flavipsychrobacter sp.]|nr:hypothetical protein [Flavipsychrobacter sp.]